VRLALLLLALVVACGHRFDPQQAATLEASVVAVGAAAPDAPVTRPSGGGTTLAAAIGGHAQTIVVFYRGFF
jgi:hypothetical protein